LSAFQAVPYNVAKDFGLFFARLCSVVVVVVAVVVVVVGVGFVGVDDFGDLDPELFISLSLWLVDNGRFEWSRWEVSKWKVGRNSEQKAKNHKKHKKSQKITKVVRYSVSKNKSRRI
jgi:hypothetical protein